MTVSVTFAGSGDAFGSGGRFNTCILVDAPGIRFAIDFGASSLVALNKLDIEHSSIDVVLLTHFHGDHCGGVPFLLLDAMLGAKRETPLTIAGPADTATRLPQITNALFPGSDVMTPKFELDIVEMATMTEHEIRALKVRTFPAVHAPKSNPTAIRVEVAGKVIAYTGDGEWTEHVPELARGADLLIAECYAHSKAVSLHMNYPDLLAHRDEIEARRIVLTHFGPEMLAQKDAIPEDCAYDGLKIEL